MTAEQAETIISYLFVIKWNIFTIAVYAGYFVAQDLIKKFWR